MGKNEPVLAPDAALIRKSNKTLDVPALEGWLWEAACKIRGPLDAPKFKDYILPLIFLKRLSDVFDDEVAHLAHDFGDQKTAAKLGDIAEVRGGTAFPVKYQGKTQTQ